MTAHTPGPWTWGERSRNVKGLPYYVTRDEVQNGEFGVDDFVADVGTEADARLIAAAPDLLSAAAEAVRAFWEGGPGTLDDAVTKLADAIDKAEGRS